MFVGVYLVSGPYMRTVAADEATARAGIEYLYWFAPGLALQFPMVAMFATLRATGMVKPTMILQVVTVLVNIVLAPVLIVGWRTGQPWARPARAWPARSRSVVGMVLSAYYFHNHEKYVAVHREQLRSAARGLGPAAHHRAAGRPRVLAHVASSWRSSTG